MLTYHCERQEIKRIGIKLAKCLRIVFQMELSQQPSCTVTSLWPRLQLYMFLFYVFAQMTGSRSSTGGSGDTIGFEPRVTL